MESATFSVAIAVEAIKLRRPLALLPGGAALGSGVGLPATSAWLISTAALQPPVLTLMVAITGVRAFGIGRGIFRYAERLVGHDAAFRGLTGLRVVVYASLERPAPTVPSGRRRRHRNACLSPRR